MQWTISWAVDVINMQLTHIWENQGRAAASKEGVIKALVLTR